MISFRIILLTIGLIAQCNQVLVSAQSGYIPPHLPQAAALVAESFTSETALPTVTVRGFLNFRTTVDGTVIVFTPASAAGSPESIPVAISSSVGPSRIEVTSSPAQIQPTQVVSSSQIRPTTAPQPILGSNVDPGSGPQYPTGLVTVLGGTVVLNGATTVYETKVIGTYINGKYAQILKSSSQIKGPSSSPSFSAPTLSSTRSAEIRPTQTLSRPISSIKIRPNSERRDFGNLRSEPSSENVRRIRPIKVLESSRKEEEPKETETESTGNRVKIRRPTRIGTRLTYTPRENPRVRLNRFKVKVASPSTASPTSREKVEEEAAKEINQRFQKRLGIGRSTHLNTYRRSRSDTKERAQHNSPVQTQPSVSVPREDESRESDPQNLNSQETDSQGSYAPPLFDLEPPHAIEPSAPLKQVQTITTEITQHLNGNTVKVDTVTLVTTVDEPIHPSARLLNDEGDLIEPTEPLLLAGNDVSTNGLETPPIVLSRTYSLTEHLSRTTVVPVFDGTVSSNHTITESFVIRKLITAYKTMPPGDLTLLATASADMANGTAFLDGLDTSEQNLEPSLLGGAIELTSSPDDLLGKSTSVLPNGGLQTLDPSVAFNGLELGQQNLPPFDLSNPLVVGAALRNPALAAIYLGLQNYQHGPQGQPQYETITKPTEVIVTETVYNTKVLSFYDGRATRTRTITEPASTIEKTVTTMTTQVTPRLNTADALAAAQAQQFQRLIATQLLQPNGIHNNPVSIHPGFNGYNGFGGQQGFQGFGSPNQQFFQNQQGLQNSGQGYNQNNFNQLAFGRALGQFGQQVQPAQTLTHTYTTVTSLTSTMSKIYTLKYNAFSTKYRTVTSTSVYPTTITTTSTVLVQPTLGPAFNPLFG